MNALKAYLDKSEIKRADFAAQVGTTEATLSRLALGKLRPSLQLAHAIERETGGVVPTETWVGMPPTEQSSQAAA